MTKVFLQKNVQRQERQESLLLLFIYFHLATVRNVLPKDIIPAFQSGGDVELEKLTYFYRTSKLAHDHPIPPGVLP